MLRGSSLTVDLWGVSALAGAPFFSLNRWSNKLLLFMKALFKILVGRLQFWSLKIVSLCVVVPCLLGGPQLASCDTLLRHDVKFFLCQLNCVTI